jgi:hypothetical protein
MRHIYLPVFALMAATVPAVAGTDVGDAPNPFTDPAAGQPSTAIPDKGVTAVDPSQLPIPMPALNGELTPPPDESKSSGSFYQAQKKDPDNH